MSAPETINGTHVGSSFDDFLKEEGLFDACEAVAVKRVIAWQLQNFIEQQRISKTEIARRMGSSRSFVDRILDASNTSITLGTILKVANVTGTTLRISFGNV